MCDRLDSIILGQLPGLNLGIAFQIGIGFSGALVFCLRFLRFSLASLRRLTCSSNSFSSSCWCRASSSSLCKQKLIENRKTQQHIKTAYNLRFSNAISSLALLKVSFMVFGKFQMLMGISKGKVFCKQIVNFIYLRTKTAAYALIANSPIWKAQEFHSKSYPYRDPYFSFAASSVCCQ